MRWSLKRFIVTDTLGLLLVVMVCAASVQDRDGAKSALLGMYLAVPVRFVFADTGPCPNAEAVATSTFQLPVHPNLPEATVEWMAAHLATIAREGSTP